MRCGQSISDSNPYLNRLSPWKWSTCNPAAECLAFQQLGNGEVSFCLAIEIMNRKDVWMRERSNRFCFPFETKQRIRIAYQALRQNLHRYVAIQANVARAIDFAHAADAQR